MLGLFGIIGYHYFFFASLKYTLINNTAIINAFSPVVTGILAAVFIREKLSYINYLGILIALIGVLGLITGGNIYSLIEFKFNKGDILMLCAVISWAVYSLIVKYKSPRYSSFVLTYYSSLAGVLILILLVPLENSIYQLKLLSSQAVLSIIYMGVFASGVGYLMYNISTGKIGPTKTSSVVYSIVPVFAAILALAFFNEVLNMLSIVSMVFIMVGLNLVMIRRNRRN